MGGKTASLENLTSPPLRPSNTLTIFVEGSSVKAIVDSGASISVIHSDLCSQLRKVTTPYTGLVLHGANGVTIKPRRYCTAIVFIDGIRHHMQLAVLSPCAPQLILGWDFLFSASAVIPCRQPSIHRTDTDLATLAEAAESRLVTATDFVLPPSMECFIFTTSRDIIDKDVFIVPTRNFAPKGVVVPPCLVRFSHGSALLGVQNSTLEPITARRSHYRVGPPRTGL